MTTFSIQTFGCRVNQAEAFSWAEEFQKQGLRYEKDFLRGDLVLVNTCTLTSRADSDVRGFLRKVARENPKAKVVVTGCYVEREKRALEDNPQVWRVFANHEKEKLAAEVFSQVSSKDLTRPLPFRSRGLVKIQDGCSLQCSFCIIPGVRGKSSSLLKSKILARVKHCLEQGFKEIVLTGVHICFYGRDLLPQSSLLELLEDLEDLGGQARIRLSSLDPRFLDEALLKHLTSSPRVCPHFHLSLQHASEKVLEQMGRKTKLSVYEDILGYLARRIPLASLGADIIAGFPGETEEDFRLMADFLKKSPLTYFHVFSFSPRPGTPAALLPQVPAKIKTQRSEFLRNLSQEKNLLFRRRSIGKDFDAVVIKRLDGHSLLLTSNYVSVRVPGSSKEEGEGVRVRITGAALRETQGEFLDGAWLRFA